MRVTEPNPLSPGDSMKECPDCHAVTNATSICRTCGYFLLAPDSNIVAASLWRRFFAYLLDYWVLPILTLVVGWLIWFYFTAKAGQSPGKRLLGIRVMNADGTAITAGDMWKRDVGAKFIVYSIASYSMIASWLVVFSYVRAFWNGDKQTWHDKIFGTLVVTSKSEPLPFSRTELTRSADLERAADRTREKLEADARESMRLAVDRAREMLERGAQESFVRMHLQTRGLSKEDAESAVAQVSEREAKG